MVMFSGVLSFTWKSDVSFSVADVVNDSGNTTSVHDELAELGSVLGDLSDQSGGVFDHNFVAILIPNLNPHKSLNLPSSK